MRQKYILFVLFSLFALKGNSQNNYAVNPIPFQPYLGTLVSLTTADDLYSPAINLPFSFDFYGVTYNQVVVSTNGYIDFRISQAGLYSPWNISQITIPNSGFLVKNSILGCYEDLNNSSAFGSLTYGIYGSAPYRKFVVYFNNQPHFGCNNTALSSFQMILNETSNSVDVQLINRQQCATWQGGRGVVGLINLDGTQGIAPPGRNTGNWNASQEAWRFSRAGYYPTYSFVRCDDNSDGFQSFDLTVAANDLSPVNSSGLVFYETATDAQAQANPIVNINSYFNISNPQIIYASGNGAIKPLVLSVIDCAVDADNDSVPSNAEDLNGDTNLANDDTDLDGVPNYLDNDDDGDLVLSNVEYVFAKTNSIQGAILLLDTDNDGTPNYLDNDDDGDGLLTWREDYNRDGNPINDDTNSNGIPDYLEATVTLGVTPVNLNSDSIKVFPNPATNELNIQNDTEDTAAIIEIYAISGAKVKSLKTNQALTSIAVGDLQSGIYFVKVTRNNQVGNYKFIKN